MNSQEFVDVIRVVVMDASVADVIATVSSPPGRRPAEELVALSRWYNSLGDEERGMVRRLSELVARHSVFGLLAVLDGARQIEARAAKGHLELRYVDDDGEEILGGPGGAVLHELL